MARTKLKSVTTTLKMTPEVRDLWAQCAEKEYRSLTSMFEVMVRDYAKKAGVEPSPMPEAPVPAAKANTTTTNK